MLRSIPPKTTFGGPNSPEGQRISRYMEQIADDIAEWVARPDQPIAIHVWAGLPRDANLLVHHDLDNFLEPLATRLGSRRVVHASATKTHADVSTLTIGPAERADGLGSDWQNVVVTAAGLSNPERRGIARALAREVEPLPWGPVDLDVALRLGAGRNVVDAWKKLIDSLVPLLGREPGKSEFDIEDGRIVSLALHTEIDPRLEHRVQAQVAWRAGPAVPRVGPPLEYDPLDAQPVPAPAHGSPSQIAPTASGMMDPITTLDRLRRIQTSGRGFIVITDTANPPKMHRAGCSAINERYFVTKVVENQMRNGQYVHVSDIAAGESRWPHLTRHNCV